jgi:hypothetical protein
MGGVSNSFNDATGSTGGKGGFGGDSYTGPQMGFGMDANTGLPSNSQPQSQQVLQQAGNMIGGDVMGMGGNTSNILGNQPAANTLPTFSMGGGGKSMQSPQVLQQANNMVGGNVMGFGSQLQSQQALQQAGNMVGGNVMGFGSQLQGPQMRGGPAGQPIMNQPGMQQAIGNSMGMSNLTGQVQNRFTPPNAPGVRTRPFTRPRTR